MYRIFGPPGTGKTTRLLGMVDEALGKGTPPSSIAFLAFTKKAATEAKERAMERFGLKENDLPYFRTIHSLAYQMVGMKSEQMIQADHFKELAHYIGIDLNTTSDALTEDDVGMRGSQHPILTLINLARLKKISLWDAYNESEIDEKWSMIEYVETAYKKFKDTNFLYDFTDLLEMFVEDGHNYCPKFALCFLDEAQDLSPLQWDIAHILDKKSDRMYSAGDDDQAIYRWNGADVEQFIHLDGPSEVLDQSYRVPMAIHQFAESISNRIQGRYTKSYGYKPDTRGSVNHVETMTGIDMSKAPVLPPQEPARAASHEEVAFGSGAPAGHRELASGTGDAQGATQGDPAGDADSSDDEGAGLGEDANRDGGDDSGDDSGDDDGDDGDGDNTPPSPPSPGEMHATQRRASTRARKAPRRSL